MTAETVHLYRAAALGEWTDERTVEGRIFPFGETARVADPNPDGTADVYDEEFLPGCTRRMRQASPQRIRFTLDHAQDFDHHVGHCTQLAERDDGVYCAFELYDGHDLPKVQSMLRTSHSGLSVEFLDVTRTPPTGDHRQRRQIHIFAVTATPIPAYSSARILAMRDADPYAVPTPNLDRVRTMLAAWPASS